MKVRSNKAKELLLHPEREHQRIMMRRIVDLITQSIPEIVAKAQDATKEN